MQGPEIAQGCLGEGKAIGLSLHTGSDDATNKLVLRTLFQSLHPLRQTLCHYHQRLTSGQGSSRPIKRPTNEGMPFDDASTPPFRRDLPTM
jgi:hypothetical protein